MTEAVQTTFGGASGTRRSELRRAAGCALWIVLLMLLGLFMIDAFVRQMLYPMPPVPVPAAPPPLQDVRLETTEGDTVIGWYGAADSPDAPPVQVLFLHGNGENLATLRMAGVFEEFAGRGASVLAVDYPGYGRSGGRPSEKANVAAAVAGCRWLAQRDGSARRVIMGWSLGAAVAAQAAARCRDVLDALVLASPWNDLTSVAEDHFPSFLVRLAVSDGYDSEAALRDVDLPMVLIHGERDNLVPTRHGVRLRDALQRAGRDVTWVRVPRAGHNDLMGRPEVWRTVDGVLSGLPRRKATSGPR